MKIPCLMVTSRKRPQKNRTAWSNLAELPIFSNVSKEMGTETKRCPDTIPENSSAVFSEAKTQAELQQMPINLVVCADVRHVVICISDLAHGIPRHVGSRIWSCLGRKRWGRYGKMVVEACLIMFKYPRIGKTWRLYLSKVRNGADFSPKFPTAVTVGFQSLGSGAHISWPSKET